MQARKVVYVKERMFAEVGRIAPKPISRVAAIGVIDNPLAGAFTEDPSPLFDVGLREELMPAAVGMLDGAPLA